MSAVMATPVHAATRVTHAAVVATLDGSAQHEDHASVVLVARGDQLHAYGPDPDEPSCLSHVAAFHMLERVDALVQLGPHAPHAHTHGAPEAQGWHPHAGSVLVLAPGGTADVYALGRAPAGPEEDPGPPGAPAPQQQRSLRLTQLASCALGLPVGIAGTLAATAPRPEGPTVSSPLHVGTPRQGQQQAGHPAERTMTLVAAAVYQDFLHVLRLQSSGATPGCVMSCTPLHLGQAGLSGMAPPGPRSQLVQSVHVRCVELLPAPHGSGDTTCMVVLLHQVSGPGHSLPTLNLDCVEFDWLTGAVAPGPWCMRDVHPTTNLLMHLPRKKFRSATGSGKGGGGGSATPPGVLVFSARTLMLLTLPGQLPVAQLAEALSAAAAAAAAAAVAEAAPMAGTSSWQHEHVQSATDTASEHNHLLSIAALSLAHAAETSPSVPPSRTVLARWALDGIPTAATWLIPGRLLLMADSAAGLILVRLPIPSGGDDGSSGAGPSTARVTRVCVAARGPPLSPASTLRFVPAAATQQQQQQADEPQFDGIVLLGSSSSSSQALAVPAGTLADAADGRSGDVEVEWTLADAALVKSLSPVLCALHMPDEGGGSDAGVLVCCGEAPAGRLARARLGVALRPYPADGPQVPAGVRMFALAAGAHSASGAAPSDVRAGPAYHTHLAFSLDAAGATNVMRVCGDSFGFDELRGIDSGVPSLLMADCPGGHLLQVTSDLVRCIPSGGGPPFEWRPPRGGTLSQPATRGGWLAAAVVERAGALGNGGLVVLAIEAASGALTLRHHSGHGAGGGLQHMSALALLQLPAHTGPATSSDGVTILPEGSVYVALGEWSTSTLRLSRLSDLDDARAGGGDVQAPDLSLELPDGETARSACMVPGSTESGRPLLLVGTNTGTLLMWQLVAGGEGVWAAEPPCPVGVAVSNVAVELSEVQRSDEGCGSGGSGGGGAQRGRGGYVYAHSGSDAIVRLREDAASEPAPASAASVAARVDVVRVHGGAGLRAVCARLHAETMPNSLAWVSHDGALAFGRLDARGTPGLEWSTAHVRDTPGAVALHTESGTLVVLMQDLCGRSWLRLVHATTLVHITSLPLAPGHHYTCLAVAHLPASSGGTKPFVLLGSYLQIASAADSSLGPGLQQSQPLLSVFEVALTVHDVAAAGDVGSGSGAGGPLVGGDGGDDDGSGGGGSTATYSLLLHGTVSLPAVAMALTTAVPGTGMQGAPAAAATAASTPLAASAAGSASAGGSSSVPIKRAPPLLVAGCQDGLYVFSINVDDVGKDGPAAVRAAADSVSRVEDLPFYVPPPPDALLPPHGSGGGIGGTGDGDGGGAAGGGAAGGGCAAAGGGCAARDADDEEDEENVMAAYNAGRIAMDAMDLGDDGSGGTGGGGSAPSGEGAGAGAEDERGAAGGGSAGVRGGAARRAARDVDALLQRDWNQHVTLALLDRSDAFARVAVTSVAACGSALYATEFLGSVSVYELRATGGGAALLPVSVDRRAAYMQALLPLPCGRALCASHPHGLVLLARDAASEARAQADAAERDAAEREVGQGQRRQQEQWARARAGAATGRQAEGGGPGAAAAALPLARLTPQQSPDLAVAASARLRHALYTLLPGRLGLAMAPLALQQPATTAAGADFAPIAAAASGVRGAMDGSGSTADCPAEGEEHAVVPALGFSVDGAVVSLRVLPPGCLHTAPLLALSHALQRLPSVELARLTGVLALPGSGSGASSLAARWRLRLGGTETWGWGVEGGGAAAGAAPAAAPGAAPRPAEQPAPDNKDALPCRVVDGWLVGAAASLPRCGAARARLAAALRMNERELDRVLGAYERMSA
ncbi:hypothetical protein FOA52_000557 [Chlamydomonas sp. UWO 241]|nr:hypothetical protein FOA52_000557 [Chlamydomonas sp. UWO 241]